MTLSPQQAAARTTAVDLLTHYFTTIAAKTGKPLDPRDTRAEMEQLVDAIILAAIPPFQRPLKGETWIHKGLTYPDGAVRVVECDNATVQFSFAGGGLVYNAPLATFLEKHERVPDPAPEVPWMRAQFELDEAGPWDGWHQGFRWNGWATPAFDKDTTRQILTDVQAAFTESDEGFVFDESDGADEPVRLVPFRVTIDGIERSLFQFDGWTFTRLDPVALRRKARA